MNEKSSRVFKIKEQVKNIYFGAKGFVLLKTFKKYKLMNKKFKERIMLAVTEVNGCEMCSYIHTKIALNSGMSSENIKMILDGDVGNVPEEEAVAVMFAQHFAFSKEQPSNDAVTRLIETYGFQKAELVLAACNMITMTNGMGTALDYLYNRIIFRKYKKSNLLSEIINPLITMILFPLFTLFNFMMIIFNDIKLLNRKYATDKS